MNLRHCKNRSNLFRFLCIIFLPQLIYAKAYKRVINLWPHQRQSVMFMSMPLSEPLSDFAAPLGKIVSNQPIEALPPRPAVLICPGGSYHHLGMRGEGHTTAKWFNSLGCVSFVLRYRVAQGGYAYPAQREDAECAIALIREHAAEWGIDPQRVGAIGYSAGGHLVTMLGAFATGTSRPDAVMPIYPVVSMDDDIANVWSRKSLMGRRTGQEAEELKAALSMEKHIPSDMPPVYLVACRDDDVVDYANSVRLYDALQKAGVECRFASYDWGGHGFGMKNGAFMHSNHWNEALKSWLKEIGFLP